MSGKTRRLILEVGCGAWPLSLGRSTILTNPTKYEPRITPLMDEYADLESGDRFICIDKSDDSIKKAQARLEELAKNNHAIDASRVTLRQGDGRNLKFKNKSVDVVAFSDVFSAPYPGATPASEPYPAERCISDRAKRVMIQEAMRVLKDAGVLLVCIHLTPCYARDTMEWIEEKLVKTGKLQLMKQCGEFVGRSDDWYLYHAAFQKMPAPVIRLSEMVPWTERQKEYIREYAWSWMMY